MISRIRQASVEKREIQPGSGMGSILTRVSHVNDTKTAHHILDLYLFIN